MHPDVGRKCTVITPQHIQIHSTDLSILKVKTINTVTTTCLSTLTVEYLPKCVSLTVQSY